MTEALPRALMLQGASNVRDLGGWPTEDGGRVRFGHVFRSAALTGLTEHDAAALAGTGVRAVCDLRGRQEAAKAPSALGGVAGATAHALPIEPSVGASLRDLVATRNATGENVMAVMRQAYVAYALEWPHRYRAIFALLVDGDAAPLLLHCSAGKDRTGFGAALILTALGVPYEAVREDYLASNRLWRGDAGFRAGSAAERRRDAAACPPRVAGRGLRRVRRRLWRVRAVRVGDAEHGCRADSASAGAAVRVSAEIRRNVMNELRGNQGPRYRHLDDNSAPFESITVDKLTPIIGAEIGGVDLSKPLGNQHVRRDPSRAGREPGDLLPRPASDAGAAPRFRPQLRRAAYPSRPRRTRRGIPS